MSLPVSTFVGVSVTVAPQARGTRGFGVLAFVSPSAAPTITQTERFRKYSSFDGVVADFPSGEIYKAAQTYYAQNPTPTDFVVVGTYGVASAASITGAAPDTLDKFKAITAGGLTLSIGGTPLVIGGINFSGIANYAAAVPILQAKVGSAGKVTYDNNVFKIESATTGVTSTITRPSAALQALDVVLGWNTGVMVKGAVEETPAVALNALWDLDRTTYGVTLDKKWTDQEAVITETADWAEAMKRVFFNTTNEAAALQTGVKGDASVIAKLKAKSLNRTLSMYSSKPAEYPAVSIAGRAFTVNFEGTNTTITLMYKKCPSITVEDLTPSQYSALTAKNGNAFVNVDGSSMHATSTMASGAFLDTIHGTDWLQNSIETGVFNLLYRTATKIPYTDVGAGMIVQRVEQSLRQGVTNGLIAPGYTPEGVYLPLGYKVTYIPVAEVSASDKSARVYRGITFQAVGAGAMHTVFISGSFSE